MSGQMMNYKRYYEYVKTMPDPIMPSQLPKVKVNLRAVAKYAKKNNICFANMTESEKTELLRSNHLIDD
jgi:hypothetical protein